MFNQFGARLVWRIIVSSQRQVATREYKSEPGIFYYCRGRSVGGPFQNNDKRFRLAQN